MKFYFSFFILCAFCTLTWAQSSQIRGKVTDPNSGEELISATVQIFQEGVFVNGLATDFNGDYRIKLDPGTYDVLCSYLGYSDKRINGVIVESGKSTYLNIEMNEPELPHWDPPICYYYRYPIFYQEPPKEASIRDGQDIRPNPSKSIKEMAAMTAGVSIGQ